MGESSHSNSSLKRRAGDAASGWKMLIAKWHMGEFCGGAKERAARGAGAAAGGAGAGEKVLEREREFTSVFIENPNAEKELQAEGCGCVAVTTENWQ
jgi:hypothetical protein